MNSMAVDTCHFFLTQEMALQAFMQLGLSQSRASKEELTVTSVTQANTQVCPKCKRISVKRLKKDHRIWTGGIVYKPIEISI